MELSEAIEKCRVDDVFLCEGPRQPQMGSLALIGHHLIFSPQPASSKRDQQQRKSKNEEKQNEELWLLHRAVDRVIMEPIPLPGGVSGGLSGSDSTPSLWSMDGMNRAVIGYFNSATGGANVVVQAQAASPEATGKDFAGNIQQQKQGAFLRIKCKNFMQCCFELSDLADAQAVARSIETLSNLSTFEHDYPFYYRCPFKVLDDGWTQFDIEQTVFPRLQIHCPDRWRISFVNADFDTCSSYPEKVIVPKGIGDDYLRISATYRDGGRFPVLSYYHHKTKSSILRCGQPLVGPTNRRCREDECMLNSLLSGVSKGMIFDTRPKLAAQTARTKGGGCESPIYYSQWKYVNGRVPRARELRDSLARLVEACLDQAPDRWLSRLAGSGWLQYVSDTMTAAATVAQFLHCFQDMPVLVHGADGTDSTLLVTALAQVLLDADARTLRGFEALVENEWTKAGHPFFHRCAHSAFATGATTGPHESPVFLCFLDCVWQIMRQYPRCFEFNEQFLVFLFEHAYASEFGTFLGNNEWERKRYEVKTRTVSLWSYLNHPVVMAPFVTALYEPYEQTLWPSVAPQSIQLWERMFLRWQRNWTREDRVRARLEEWRRAEIELQSRATAMLSAANSCVNTPTSTDIGGHQKQGDGDIAQRGRSGHPLAAAPTPPPPPIPPRRGANSPQPPPQLPPPMAVISSPPPQQTTHSPSSSSTTTTNLSDPLGALKLEQLNITPRTKRRRPPKKPVGDPGGPDDGDNSSFEELLEDALERELELLHGGSGFEAVEGGDGEFGEEGDGSGGQSLVGRLVATAARSIPGFSSSTGSSSS